MGEKKVKCREGRGVGKRERDSKGNYQKVVGIVVFKGKQKFRLREGVRKTFFVPLS